MAVAISPMLAFRSRSPAVRGRYIETAEQASRNGPARSVSKKPLETCVAWLELFHISAVACEYLYEHGALSVEALRARADEVDQHLRASIIGFDESVEGILHALPEFGFEEPPPPPDHAYEPSVQADWAQIVRSFDAIAAECPIHALEALGRKLNEPSLAHRARNAYDALRAFVRRHDPGCAEVKRIVGEHYRRGNFQLAEVASLLNLSTSDAVFELEQDGYVRPAEAITLADSEREAIYARLRRRRLEATGSPAVDPDLLERDVIASERIEGVDARAWIRRR